MKARLKHILSFMVLGLLFLPMVQLGFGLATEQPLAGIGADAPRPHWAWGNWWNSSYQDSLQSFTAAHCGFHNTLIRLNNQYYFTAYHSAIANSVIIGQDNYLYDNAHISAYTGADFMGETALARRMAQILELKQILQKKGIQLLLVLAPGKASGAPEHLPLGTPAPGPTNHQYMVRAADSLQIPILDLMAWMKMEKTRSPYPLYPSGGIHWSQYCASLVADTLFGHLSKLTSTPLNHFSVKAIHRDEARGEDADVLRGMNLLFPLRGDSLAYPEVIWDQDPLKLKVLTVSDSYFFHLFCKYTEPVFEKSTLWFYFNELHRLGNLPTKVDDPLAVVREVEQQDVVILFSSDAHLPEFGWGFVETLLQQYHDVHWRGREIQRISEEIRRDANWMATITTKANSEGIAVDSMLRRDATWVLETTRVK